SSNPLESGPEIILKPRGFLRCDHDPAGPSGMLAFRHGLRVSELCSLRWEQADIVHARLHVSRLKSGIPLVHPLTGTELRALTLSPMTQPLPAALRHRSSKSGVRVCPVDTRTSGGHRR